MSGNGVFWTEERDAVLRTEWAAKTTVPAIASKLGGFDHTADGGRSAVIGRAHRLGLERRTSANRRLDPEEKQWRLDARYQIELERRKRVRREAQGLPEDAILINVRPPKPTPPPYEPKGISFGELRDFSTQRPNQCRYIDVKDVGPNYLYCGSETLPGESYCGHCAEICRPSRQTKAHELTDDQREALRIKGQALGFANIRAGRSYGRTFTPSMVPVVDGEAIV